MDIRGIVPAMVTPLDAEERVDEGALRQLVRHLLAADVHALMPMGSQGEFYALDPIEKERALDVVLDEVNRRVPVLFGSGAVTTREACALTRMAERRGADGVVVITPYFIAPNQEELYEHFKRVAEATSLPVFLYSNPPRTRVEIGIDLLEKMLEYNPARRISARDALKHPYFEGVLESLPVPPAEGGS